MRILVTPAVRSTAAAIEPLTLGVPFAAGVLRDPQALRLHVPDGPTVALQSRALERWSDGTVRWVLLDFQRGATNSSPVYHLTWAGGPVTIASPLRISESQEQVEVDTGAAHFVMRTGGAFPFARVSACEHELLDVLRSRFTAEDAHGRPVDAKIDRISVEESGPLRAVVLASGRLVRARQTLVDLAVRLHFFAGLTTVRVVVTVRNSRRARHPGGFWELGDRGSVYLRDLSLSIALKDDEPAAVRCSVEPGAPESSVRQIEIYQASSGGRNWASPAHANRHGRVPLAFCGYRLRTDERCEMGRRATPCVTIATPAASAAVTMRQFWQNSPKAVEAADGAITLRLWPRQHVDAHEIQGGEQKTHELYLDVRPGEGCDLEWCRRPAVASVEPSFYALAEAVPYLSGVWNCTDPVYLQLTAKAIDGTDSFERKREDVDEYGWRNFGDLYADHERPRQAGGPIFVSHYNNQYDAVGAFATHFMRTGDKRWRELMDDLAHHVVDIDTYHTDADKAAYNNALFWHTAHYVDAGLSTHRSYPRDRRVGGGGPANEHNYSTGLLLHHLMTGDPLSRETVIGYARWVVAMDDGLATPFRWLARSCTGLASQTASPSYHGPGRGAGYSIRTLLDGHRLTGDDAFLIKAEQLIRRSIGPSDTLEPRDLLNRELRWSYTVFLQALGRYLDYKAECGRRDAMYSYAKACLLHYARWMCDHEYPYLERPEQLEYPTETWAAQDLRKSEVFDFAARHASDSERERFLEKASFFWRRSIDTLAAMPTHTLTRPMVLLLGHGLLRDHMARRPGDRAAAADVPVEHTSERNVFEPQKALARRRFTWMTSAAASVCAAVALWWLAHLL